MARVYPFALMFVSLGILCIPGILFNNYTNLGFNQASEPNLACGGPYFIGTPVDVTCQGSVSVGCQVHINCGLADTNTVSFFSGTSPFTPLFSGNINGFWGSLTTVSPNAVASFPSSSGNAIQTTTPYAAIGGGAYYTANCYNAGVKENWNSFAIKGCTLTTALGNANFTTAASAGAVLSLTNWNTAATQSNETKTTPFYKLQTSNSTYGLLCTQPNSAATYLGTTNQSSLANSQPLGYWAYYGCDVMPLTSGGPVGTCPNLGTVNTVGCPFWSFLIAIPLNASAGHNFLPLAASLVHFQAYVQPVNWDAGECNASIELNLGQYASPQCTNIKGLLSMKGYQSVNQAVQLTQTSAISSILGFVIGIALLFIGMGLNFTTSGSFLSNSVGFGAGVNNQGTRFAQVLGVSLIFFTPLYSEFGTSSWITVAYLGYGLASIVSTLIIATFFIGVFWQMWQLAE